MAEDPNNGNYNDQSVYNKHLPLDCECEGTCTCSKNDDCGCCPPGLVQVFDACGQPAGCLTPHDAEEYNNGKHKCAEGYVKLFHPKTNKFIGCVSPADALDLIAAYTPAP